jgi:excisionase family DNA binding protein
VSGFSLSFPDEAIEAIARRAGEVAAEIVLKRLNGHGHAPADGYLDVKQAAEYVGRSEDGLRKLVARDEIPFHQPGGKGTPIRLRRAELDAWMRGSGRP